MIYDLESRIDCSQMGLLDGAFSLGVFSRSVAVFPLHSLCANSALEFSAQVSEALQLAPDDLTNLEDHSRFRPTIISHCDIAFGLLSPNAEADLCYRLGSEFGELVWTVRKIALAWDRTVIRAELSTEFIVRRRRVKSGQAAAPRPPRYRAMLESFPYFDGGTKTLLDQVCERLLKFARVNGLLRPVVPEPYDMIVPAADSNPDARDAVALHLLVPLLCEEIRNSATGSDVAPDTEGGVSTDADDLAVSANAPQSEVVARSFGGRVELLGERESVRVRINSNPIGGVKDKEYAIIHALLTRNAGKGQTGRELESLSGVHYVSRTIKKMIDRDELWGLVLVRAGQRGGKYSIDAHRLPPPPDSSQPPQ